MTLRAGSGPARVIVERDGRRHVATVVQDGARTWVHVDGRVFVIEDRRSDGPRASAAADHDALSPPMPATVTRVTVKPGDSVKTGDVIVLLEAMKMELPVRAPHDAVIARVNCRAGELVQPGDALVDLE